MSMHPDVREILFTQEQLRERIAHLGSQISRDYAGKQVLCVGVLKGCFIFMADLIRSVDADCRMDFMAVSSYGSATVSSGAVKITKDLSVSVEGKHVLIIEDILDSGVTLSYLRGFLEQRRPASIRICTLFDKPARRKADIQADYVGFICPDAFIVGYGLDYDERYRNLPYIGVLKPEVYA